MAKSLRRMKNKKRKQRRSTKPGGKSRYARKIAGQLRGSFTEHHQRLFPHAEAVGE